PTGLGGGSGGLATASRCDGAQITASNTAKATTASTSEIVKRRTIGRLRGRRGGGLDRPFSERNGPRLRPGQGRRYCATILHRGPRRPPGKVSGDLGEMLSPMSFERTDTT